MKKIILWLFLISVSGQTWAQCAMCRATVENSIARGHNNFIATLNTGILYLFIMPYLLAALITILWFRASKKNERKNKIRIHTLRQMPPLP